MKKNSFRTPSHVMNLIKSHHHLLQKLDSNSNFFMNFNTHLDTDKNLMHNSRIDF